MAFSTTLPANYQNGLYWQYFMQSLQQAEAMRQARLAQIQQQYAASQQPTAASQAVDTTQFETSAPVQQQIAPALVTNNTEDGKVYVVADGKDDGSISGGQIAKNLVKGAGNFFKGMFCGKDGKFSLLQTAKTVGMVAIGVAVPAVGVGMLAAGGVMSAYSIGKGAIKAANAKTDAEAEKAWQNIGEGATGLVMTLTGAKALKAGKAATPAEAMRYKGIKGYGRAIKDVYMDAGKGIKGAYKHVRENGITDSIKFAVDESGSYIKNNWEARFKSTNSKANAKARMEAAYDKQAMKLETKILELEQRIASSKNAKTTAKLRQEISEYRSQIADIIKAKSEIQEMPSVAFSRTKIKELNKLINEKNHEIAQIRKDNPNIDAQIQHRNALRTSNPKEVAQYDAQYPEVAKLSKLEKDVNTLRNLKQRIKNNPSTDGYRANQLDYYTRLESYLNAKIKKASGTEKAQLQAKLKLVQAKISENKTFRFIEKAQEQVRKSELEIKSLDAKLKKIEAKIKTETDAEKLTDLRIAKAKIESEISSNKIQIQNAKNQLRTGYHSQNITSYIKDNHKSIGYGTMAAATGDVETLDTFTQEELNALLKGFSAPEEAASAQQSVPQATQATASQYSTNPYPQFTQMSLQPPRGTGLEFQDLYKSPYSEWM